VQTSGSISVVDTSPGGASSAPVTQTWADTTPPAAPTVASTSENSAGLLTVTGHAEAGSTVTVTFPDHSIGTTLAQLDGSYSVASSVAEGSGILSITATDLADNVSAATTINFPGATVSPIHIIGITPDTGVSASDFITNDNSPVIGGSYWGSVAGQWAASVEISLDGGKSWNPVSLNGITTDNLDSNGNGMDGGWTYAATALSDGNYTVEARELDSAGNQLGAVTTQQMVIDTAAPTETITIAPTSSDGETISGALSSALADGSQPGVSAEQLQISLDNGATWQNATVDPGSTTWSYDSTTPLAAGANVEARVVDAAGNDGATVTQAVNVSHGIAGAANLVITNASSSEESGTSVSVADYDSPTVPGEQVQVSLDGGITWQSTTDGAYQSNTVVTNLSNIEARAVDGSGNFIGLPVNYVEAAQYLDLPAHNLPVESSITGIGPEPTSLFTSINGELVTNSGQLWVDGNASWGSEGYSGAMALSLDGGHTWQFTTADSSGNFAFDNTSSLLSDGLYVAEARTSMTTSGGVLGPVTAQELVVCSSGTLNLSLQDVLHEAITLNSLNLVKLDGIDGPYASLDNIASTPPVTVNSGNDIVQTVNLSEGLGTGANQWQDTGTTTVNGVLYDVYHNAAEGAVTAADLLIQHGIHVI
jgi:hypothetical protein